MTLEIGLAHRVLLLRWTRAGRVATLRSGDQNIFPERPVVLAAGLGGVSRMATGQARWGTGV